MNKQVKELEQIITANLVEMSNLKNSLREKELEKHDMLKEMALGIIQIIDSFEDIENGIMERGLNENPDVLKIMQRYKLIPKKISRLLNDFGITKVEFKENKLIVGLCEVVDKISDTSRKDEEIVSIVRNGYIRGKDLIRPAQVVIIMN